MAATLPLAGVKVLDLGQMVAGPYCTKLLAGLGAEVIKVERPGPGDPARRVGPFPDDVPDAEKSGLYLYLNTAKRSITLNLKTETGKAILRRLVEWADVVVENFEPRVLPELGLDYASLERIKPSLVMTSITNFGQDGPYRDYRGTEMTIFAAGGLMYQIGFPELPPLKFGGNIVQYSGGLSAFTATLFALYHAEMTGVGQHVDVSLAEVIASNHFQSVVEYIYTGMEHKRNRTMMIFPTQDGYVNATTQAHMWPRFPGVVGMPELLEDPRFQTVEGRRQYHDELEAMLLLFMVEHTKEEVYHMGQAAHLPFGYMASVEDLTNSAQYQARGFFVEMDHPAAGKQTYPGTPLRVGQSPWQHGRAPLLGEHNE
ncbi:MAG: CoA transferase, partial [Chloroflexi bacterium]|nr:CoA transferase [Chloroflexota bacterium]